MKKHRKTNKTLWIFLSLILFMIMSILLSQLSGTTNGEWRKTLASKNISIIYLGRPTCSWCNKYKPGLDNLSEQYNIKYTYVNTESIPKTELEAIFDALDIDGAKFGTPYTAFVQDGKKTDEISGYIPEDELFDKLQEHKFIDEDVTYTPNDKTPKEE